MNALARAASLARHIKQVSPSLGVPDPEMVAENKKLRDECRELRDLTGRLDVIIAGLRSELERREKTIKDMQQTVNLLRVEATPKEKLGKTDVGIEPIPLAAVIRAVSAQIGSTVEDILSRRRVPGVIHARKVVCFVAYKVTNLTLTGIGKRIGRDHSTVLHDVRRIEAMLAAGDADLAADIAAIRRMLGVDA